MNEKMKFVVIAVLLVSIMLRGTWTLPLNQKEKRQSLHGDVEKVKAAIGGDSGANQPAVVEDESAGDVGKGCFIVKEEEWIMTEYVLDKETRQYVARNITITRPVRECCEGYTGIECDQKLDIVEPIICGNLTCDADPDAYCAVLKKCGKEIPLFLDVNGVPSEKCNQTIDLNSLSCNGVCKEDPCSNAQCTDYPSATCFPIGCECKAVWLMQDPETDENIEVNCGAHVPGAKIARQKRDTSCSS